MYHKRTYPAHFQLALNSEANHWEMLNTVIKLMHVFPINARLLNKQLYYINQEMPYRYRQVRFRLNNELNKNSGTIQKSHRNNLRRNFNMYSVHYQDVKQNNAAQPQKASSLLTKRLRLNKCLTRPLGTVNFCTRGRRTIRHICIAKSG